MCVNKAHAHRHIISVGTGTTREHWSRMWTVEEVIAAIRSGDRFYTVSPSTGKTADVRAMACNIGACLVMTLRSHADAVSDNNLDNMPACA